MGFGVLHCFWCFSKIQLDIWEKISTPELKITQATILVSSQASHLAQSFSDTFAWTCSLCPWNFLWNYESLLLKTWEWSKTCAWVGEYTLKFAWRKQWFLLLLQTVLKLRAFILFRAESCSSFLPPWPSCFVKQTIWFLKLSAIPGQRGFFFKIIRKMQTTFQLVPRDVQLRAWPMEAVARAEGHTEVRPAVLLRDVQWWWHHRQQSCSSYSWCGRAVPREEAALNI